MIVWTTMQVWGSYESNILIGIAATPERARALCEDYDVTCIKQWPTKHERPMVWVTAATYHDDYEYGGDNTIKTHGHGLHDYQIRQYEVQE